jgi:colanic acid biosynthesis glycosyl transferase WcaI
MQILLVSPVYPPEPVVSSQTNHQIADALSERGHEVTVITGFPNRPAGKLYAGYARRLYQREKTPHSVKLVRCFTTISPQSRMISRFMENISFGLTSGLAVLAQPRADVIYANTWAIFATGFLQIVAWVRGIPMVISVQDIYPESIVTQGRLSANSWLARLMREIDRRIAQNCKAVIVISESFADIYRHDRGVVPCQVHVVPNWTDARLIRPNDPQADQVRARHDIHADSFVMSYGGNIGVAAGVETILESFRSLLDVDELCLLIAGAGSSLNACQRVAEEIGSPRVKFHSPWPVDETSAVLGAADVMVLPTRGDQSLASVPSKLITYMLAARPVVALAVASSDLSKTIEQAGCGWVVDPDRPVQLAEKMREIIKLPKSELAARGQAGRDYALKNFVGEVCLPKVIRVLEQAAS